MRRRTFLATLPAVAAAGPALAQSQIVAGDNPNRKRPDVHAGDRIAGANFASRSAAWGVNGAAATAHPLATQAAIGVLKRGGSAADAAVAANACLGLMEPIACGIGGDCYVLLWDPKAGKVMGLNSSGRSPRGLSLETVRSRADARGLLPSWGAVTVSVPGTVDAWRALHERYGKLKWAELFDDAIHYAEAGHPITQNVAFYLAGSQKRFTDPASKIEEVENFLKVWAPTGRTPAEGEIFKNPALGRTYRLIAQGGGRAFYEGEIAETIERYFRRIGGWMTRADLAAHKAVWTQVHATRYRGVEVHALGDNTQGLATLQMLNIMETFDYRRFGFQSAAAIHHSVEAKRLAYEDRARFYADQDFYKSPVEWLISKDYARERARLIRPDRILTPVYPGQAPSRGDTTYFTTADADGMMVSIIQSNYRGMGSGLSPDGLGFMLQDRGELFATQDGHPNIYAPGKRPFQTIIPGFATRDGQPWLAFGVMGGDMQPQGQVQIISNMVDFGLGVQEAGDSPRWHHGGSSEPTGEPQQGVGVLNLETGVPAATQKALAALGWSLRPDPGGYGGYQAIERWPGRYAAATEMRKDGVALAY
ncbi:gamma-glutamyltransferase family protein [Phenylobacterium sp. J426]|uniref:gamma-glutamyltransferase family protein n=1 Tax=Phenylobacterium sp. J426 TaxID=2898439 RepID=UPI002150D11E|nr:gamma-glutamyltransferase family protein [Phenylobacterium sp. J426]MCR5873353.1 gamma-glutamyltransferase family protein [Phenylobacterium sp. J426]